MVSQPISSRQLNSSPPTDLESGTMAEQFYQHHFTGKRDRQVATSTSKTNLYIKGLQEETTDKDLFDMCERWN